MIKWTNHIISWHAFHSPFQVLTYLESNNISRTFLEATSIFQTPPNSIRQILAQTQEANEPVKASLSARLFSPAPWPTALFLQTARLLWAFIHESWLRAISPGDHQLLQRHPLQHSWVRFPHVFCVLVCNLPP